MQALLFIFGIFFRIFPQQLINLRFFSHSMQSMCVSHAPAISKYRDELSSMVCGSRLQNPQLLANLKASGIFHIFVISGAHLIFLLWLFEKIRLPPWLKISVLVLYAILTDLQAPVVRALFGLLLFQASQSSFQSRNNLRKDQKVFFIGLFTLMFFPDLCSSFSLALSWTCALVLSMTSNLVLASLLIWIFLNPLFWGIAVIHPHTILWNIFVAPFISAVLFPLGLLTYLIPPLGGVFQKAMDVLIGFYQLFPERIMISEGPVGALISSPVHRWIYIFTLHLFLHFYFTFKLRKKLT